MFKNKLFIFKSKLLVLKSKLLKFKCKLLLSALAWHNFCLKSDHLPIDWTSDHR